MKATQNRDRADGRFTFDGNWDRLCVCGHKLGAHLAAGKHPCDNANHGKDGSECECPRFRPAK